MPPIKAIFFDLDQTLLDFDDQAYELVVARVCQALTARFPAVDPQRLQDAYQPLNAARWLSPATTPSLPASGLSISHEVWQQALAVCGCSDSVAADEVTDLHEAYCRESYRLFDDVAGTLEYLYGRFKLAVITNGPNDIQRDKLRVLGLDRYFRAIVTSGEHGFSKPDAAIFKVALDGLGVGSTQALHVGDNLTVDVAGALNAGLGAAVWLNRTGAQRDASHPTPHHEITSLAELPGLLG